MAEPMPKVGDPAPEFTLPTGDGQTVSLRDFRGRAVVLYFYPKDNTPGCTREACDFRDHLQEFEAQGAVVLGVSTDSVRSHQRFAQQYQLSFPLLSDEGREVSRRYGVYQQKTRFGRTYWGIERTTFLIDPEGKIARVWPKVKVEGHVEEVLQALKELQA